MPFSVFQFIFHGYLHWKDVIPLLFNLNALALTKEAAIPAFGRATYGVQTDGFC